MAAETAESFQKIKCNATLRTNNLVGALAHIHIVEQSETKDFNSNGHVIPPTAKVENDDSDEDKDADGGIIEAEVPGGKLAPECGRYRWLTVRSCEEKEKAQA